MKLKVKNFKCFENFSINLPDHTMSLLSAPSGFGKSSILESIKFALWGSKDTDIIKIGKRKCEVDLELGDVKIYRCKPPNALVVNYQGVEVEHAQEFLNTHFKKYEMGFVDLNSQNRLKVFSQIAGDDPSLDDYLVKLKTLESEGKKEVAVMTREVEVLSKTLSALKEEEPVSEPTKPDIVLSTKTSTEALEKKLRDMYTSNHVFDEMLKEKTMLEEKIKKNKVTSSTDLVMLQKEYESKSCLVQQYMVRKNLHNLLLSKKKSLEPIPPKSLSTLLKDGQVFDEKIRYNEDLQRRIKEIKLGLPRNINPRKIVDGYKGVESRFSCPCCHVPLNLVNEELVEADKTNFDIYKQCRDILSLEEQVKPVDMVAKRNLDRMISQRTEYDDVVKQLDNFILPEKMEMKDLDKLRDYISNLEKLEQINKRISSKVRFTDEELEKVKIQMAEIQQAMVVQREYQLRLKDWKNYLSNLKMRQDLLDDLNSAKIKLARYESIVVHLGTVKRLVSESRNLALKGIIKEVNKQLKYFTHKFFDDPPDIIISEFAQTTKTGIQKPIINITINYKSLSMKPDNLSSGELARVRLAIDLVLYKFTGSSSPLLLDEVSANLDSELSTKIYKAIKNYFSDTSILVISHQVIEGTFDHVYNEEVLDKCIQVL